MTLELKHVIESTPLSAEQKELLIEYAQISTLPRDWQNQARVEVLQERLLAELPAISDRLLRSFLANLAWDYADNTEGALHIFIETEVAEALAQSQIPLLPKPLTPETWYRALEENIQIRGRLTYLLETIEPIEMAVKLYLDRVRTIFRLYGSFGDKWLADGMAELMVSAQAIEAQVSIYATVAQLKRRLDLVDSAGIALQSAGKMLGASASEQLGLTAGNARHGAAKAQPSASSTAKLPSNLLGGKRNAR